MNNLMLLSPCKGQGHSMDAKTQCYTKPCGTYQQAITLLLFAHVNCRAAPKCTVVRRDYCPCLLALEQTEHGCKHNHPAKTFPSRKRNFLHDPKPFACFQPVEIIRGTNHQVQFELYNMIPIRFTWKEQCNPVQVYSEVSRIGLASRTACIRLQSEFSGA